jgi:hypothetical protein
MKSIYLIEYWVPFPSSEYGGLVSVIAQNDEEVFDILSNSDQFDDQYVNLIMPNIRSALVFPVVGDYESGIVWEFVT